MRDLEEKLHQYLHQPGQTVYLQSPRMHGRRTNKFELTSYDEDQAIDFFSSCHAKVIDNNDFTSLLNKDGKLGKAINVSNGQMALVVSCFHWALTEKEIEELKERKETIEESDLVPMIYCFLLMDDQLLLASEKYCNAVNL